MQSSRRPMSIWARPIFVGLVALTLLASASVVVAATAVPKDVVATPLQPPVEAAVHPTIPAPFGGHVVQPTDARSLIPAPASAPAATPVHGPGQDGCGHQAGSQTEGRPGQDQGRRQEGDCVLQGRLPPLDPCPRAQPRHLRLGLQRRSHPESGRVLGLRRKEQPLPARPCLGCLRPDPRRLPLGRAEGRIDRLVRRQGRQGPSLSDQLDPPCRQQGLCDLEHVGHGLVVEPDHHPPDVRRRDLRLPDPRSPGPCLKGPRGAA